MCPNNNVCMRRYLVYLYGESGAALFEDQVPHVHSSRG